MTSASSVACRDTNQTLHVNSRHSAEPSPLARRMIRTLLTKRSLSVPVKTRGPLSLAPRRSATAYTQLSTLHLPSPAINSPLPFIRAKSQGLYAYGPGSVYRQRILRRVNGQVSSETRFIILFFPLTGNARQGQISSGPPPSSSSSLCLLICSNFHPHHSP